MIDSTVRAQRLDSQTSTAPFYLWEVAQKPVSVLLPMPLIDRLEHDVVEAFRSLSSRGSEIGGLLLGKASPPGGPAVITVDDYELIDCDYSRGPLYRLSDADTGRFEQAIEKHSAGSGSRVVGFFRSHTRKGLVLDAEDVAFFDARFREPYHIALLVRPFATKASTAAIFIRENNHLCDASYQEFPFRSSDLPATARKAGEHVESAPPVADHAPPEPANPLVPKPPARAQIVPIASRREIAMPEPVAPLGASRPPATTQPEPHAKAPAESPTAPAAPKSEPPAPVSKSAPAAPSVPPPTTVTPPPPAPVAAPVTASPTPSKPPEAAAPPAPAVKEKEKEKEKESDKQKGPAIDKDKAEKKEKAVKETPAHPKVAAPAPSFLETAAAAPKPHKKLRLTVAAALGMLVLVGGFLFLYPALIHRGRPVTPAVQDSSPLSLRVERTSGGLLLTWNRDADVIKNASKVVLSIFDGDRHEAIQMDPNQVRTGSIVYPPVSADVSFQMEVTDPHQSKTTSESLRVLDPRPSPMGNPADTATQAQNTPKPLGTGAPPAADPNANAATPVATDATPAPEPPAKAAAPRKSFDPGSLAQRLRPPAASDLPEAPPDVRVNSAAPGSLGAIIPGASAPVAPARPAPANTGAPKQTAADGGGGKLVPAEPIYRKAPEYPKIARQTGASGIVELEATITVDGKVKNPHVLKGNPMLQKAALDAVAEWKYKPALLNGKPVEAPVQIKLNFVPER